MHLQNNHVLSLCQHGFRPDHSTETAMLETVGYLAANIDQGRISTLLAADTSRAFDTVEHSRLIEKLGWYGIDTHWFREWLTNRTQKIKGSNSEALSVTHGVIQGSMLGSKLFSIFTNDLAPHIANGKLVMYADDCQFLDSDSPDELGMLKERVESTLKIALKWFTQNRLKINPNKTELLVIKSRQSKHIEHISITFGNNIFQPSPHALQERWTPYGGSIRPGFKSPGFEARRAPDVYRASWRVWLRLVAGRSQSKSAIGTGRARLCAYVKLSTLNSAIDPELRDRKVEDRANATSSA